MKQTFISTVTIKEASIEEAVAFLKTIPEFTLPQKPKDEYLLRFEERKYLLLKAESSEGEIAGIKVGYEFTESTFYSWLGAVHPRFRRVGIAKELAKRQESWAKDNGFHKIRFKTLNRHKSMLLFALKNGFEIVDFELRKLTENNQIILEKSLV